MFSKIAGLVFIISMGLFLFGSSDFHDCENDCENDGEHEPFCEDCACIFCASGNMGVDIAETGFNIQLVLADFIKSSNDDINIDEYVFDFDKPPRF